MMNNPKVFFVLLGIVVICVAAVGLVGGIVSPDRSDPSKESIAMVQPYGWMPERDAHYAQNVNEPNSQANMNNGQANLYNAQATAVIMDEYKNDHDVQRKGDSVVGFLEGMACLGFVVFILFVVFIAVFAPK